MAQEVDVAVTERLNELLRHIFGRVLKELTDLENPMRTPIGADAGDGALRSVTQPASGQAAAVRESATRSELMSVDDIIPRPRSPEFPPAQTAPRAAPAFSRVAALPSIAPDPAPNGLRSRFDEEAGLVYYNDQHPDYLMVKAEEAPLLDYLSTLVAKEYVVFNNPRAAPAELAEELVRMLIRVRRYLPRRS